MPSPARRNELLPAPDGPISACRCGRRSFFHIASISSSRPTKNPASRSVNAASPGYGRCDSSPAVRSVTSSSARDRAAAVAYRCSRARATALRSTAAHGVSSRRGGSSWIPRQTASRAAAVRAPPGATSSASTTPAEKTSARASTAPPRACSGAMYAAGARHRADARFRRGAGDAEVHHHDAAGARQHHVLGLDVAVHEPRAVDGIEAGQELRREIARLRQIQRTTFAQHVGQRDAVDVLHRHQLAAVELDQVEHAAHVRRDDLARRAHFLAQAGQRALVGQQRAAHRLQGDVDAQLEVEGAEHFSHAAAAEQHADAIPIAKDLAFGERRRETRPWVAPRPGDRRPARRRGSTAQAPAGTTGRGRPTTVRRSIGPRNQGRRQFGSWQTVNAARGGRLGLRGKKRNGAKRSRLAVMPGTHDGQEVAELLVNFAFAGDGFGDFFP